MENEFGRLRRPGSPRPGSLQSVASKYGVFGPGWEQITQDFYDYQTYVQAGQTGLLFFQTPAGQGGKTLADTNMQQAGGFPQNQLFLAERIEVDFIPGNAASAGPGVFRRVVVAIICA